MTQAVMASNDKTHIFVVDDDVCILDAICLYLKKAGFKCTCFSNKENIMSCSIFCVNSY